MIEFLNSFSKLEFDKIVARLASLAATDIGRAKIHELHPLSTCQQIGTAHQQVSEMKLLIESGAAPEFDGIVDCRTIIHRSEVQGSILSAHDLRHIANLLMAAEKLRSHIKENAKLVPSLHSVSTKININLILEYNIDSAINEKGELRDDASKALKEIRLRITELRKTLQRRLEGVLENAVKNAWAQDEIVTTRDGRMVIPVKVEHKHHIPGFIHNASASGATVFIEPVESLEINNALRSALFDEEREIERILKALTVQVGQCAKSLLDTLDIIALLDTIYARAKYSSLMKGSPVSVGTSSITLKEARHPLLVEQIGYDKVVPFDFEMGKDFNTILISGPNAGGKSVLLKTIGLIVTMVYHGMHAPVSPDSEVPLLSKMFVDMGDEQSIENNLSTFTSHLVNLKHVCENTDRAALVLIDEICAGTDPAEGGALGVAFLKKLTALGSYNIVATHNSLLKAFVQGEKNMVNGCMDFDHNTLTPTYRLRIGTIGSSYALEIAERLNVHEEILSDARIALGEETSRIALLLSELERQQQEYAKKIESLKREEENVKQLAEQYKSMLFTLTQERDRLRMKALDEAKEIVRKARSKMEAIIKEIREHKAESSVTQKARKELQNEEELLLSLESDNFKHQESIGSTFTEGQAVRFKDGNEIGEIIRLLDQNTVLVLSRNAKIVTRRDQLLPANNVDSERRSFVASTMKLNDHHQLAIDVRGMLAHEAIKVVDKSLDTAILSNQPFLKIIHGKGTGALAKKLHDFLATHAQVKSFRLGEWNEGGTGVTFVELR